MATGKKASTCLYIDKQTLESAKNLGLHAPMCVGGIRNQPTNETNQPTNQHFLCVRIIDAIEIHILSYRNIFHNLLIGVALHILRSARALFVEGEVKE